MIDNLMPIENQIEQKLTALEYPNNYQVSIDDDWMISLSFFFLWCTDRSSQSSKISR